jgi:hypothetical protein
MPPSKGKEFESGTTLYEQPTILWLTVKVSPAIVSVPLRGLPVELTST